MPAAQERDRHYHDAVYADGPGGQHDAALKGDRTDPNRKAAPVRRLLILLAIIVALFLVLPPAPAMAWSSVPFLLLAALFFDAYRRGRRLLLNREADGKDDALADGARWIGGLMLVNAVWTGLGSSGALADGMHWHGPDAGMGADFGGVDAGSPDSGVDGGGMGGDF